jgi:anti-sigma regulatory factor (Ser/Thr protein kinase)
MGWIWQLRHTSLGTEARERALDSLERNTRMQAQLINDLIDVSRGSKGKLQLEMRLVDLQMVVTAANEFLREAVERKELELREQLTPVSVAGDLARLQQIVTNLLTNAVQFTPCKGRITVSLLAKGDEAVLTVEDTGAGIEPAFLPYVFDQFRQGEGGLARTHGGLGLGLTVVKQLVDLHGGTVTVDSRGTGQGATFTVCLPIERALAEDRAPGDPLLLQDVNVRVIAAEGVETSMLRSILEASGATASIGNGAPTLEAVPVSHADVTVTDNGRGQLDVDLSAIRRRLAVAREINQPQRHRTSHCPHAETEQRPLASRFKRRRPINAEAAETAEIISCSPCSASSALNVVTVQNNQ